MKMRPVKRLSKSRPTLEGAGVRLEGVRFLLVAGYPLREPVAWYGPIVMNKQEELQQAFDELQRNTFLKTTGTDR